MKNVTRRWLQDSYLGVACVFAAIAACAVWARLVVRFPLDYWDGMNFILQSRRLTDPLYQFVPFDFERPRGLVAVLASFDITFHSIVGRFPGLVGYHLLMMIVSLGFVGVWTAANARLWDRKTAYLATIFLFSLEFLHHYSTAVLGDLLTGFFWGLCVWLFMAAEISWRRAILLGMAGALAGATKYQFAALFPVLIGTYALTVSRRQFPLLGLALLSYLVTFECLLRIFSLGEAGIWGHFLALLPQVHRGLVLRARPPEIYVEALGKSLGILFWLLAVGALFFTVRIPRRLSEAQGKILAVLVASGVLALITQVLGQREVRYLFPLLPCLFGLLAWGVVRAYARMPKAGKIAWVVVWVIALCHPILRSVSDISVTLSDPLYVTSRGEVLRLWAYLKRRSLTGDRCTRVDACGYSMRASSWEFPHDEFYRSFDIGPHYSYFTRLPLEMRPCQNLSTGETFWKEAIPQLTDPEACYVLRTVKAEASGFSQSLKVTKTLGQSLSEREVSIYTKAANSIGEEVHCEERARGVYRCWSAATFLKN